MTHAIVLLLCSLAIAPAAHAQSRVDEARAQFDAAMQAARDARWSDAAAGFRAAYEAAPRPELLLNLATAEVNAGHLVAGADAYRRFIAATPRGALRRSAMRALAELEPTIAHLTVRIVGADRADARLDGAPLPPGDAFEVDPGTHHVLVGDPGSPLAERVVVLGEGERLVIELAVVAREVVVEHVVERPVVVSSEPPPARALSTEPAAVPAQRAAGGLSGVTVAGIVVMGLGAVALAVAGPWAIVEHDATRARCGDAGTCSSADVQRVMALTITADVGAGVLVAGAVLFVIGLATSGGSDDDVSLRGGMLQVAIR